MKNRYIQIFLFLVVLLSLATFSACEVDDKIELGKHTRVTTATVTQITGSSAVAGGNVMAGSNVSVTERGVCIATISNPTTSNTKVSVGSGTGSFTCNLTNLQPNTTYYVRAYAIDSKGTAYGEEVSFTTIVLPTVKTHTVYNVMQSYAVAGGNVSSDGNASVTERGVVYGTNQHPTTVDNKVSNGSGMGSFTCNLTNLQSNTTYYVRAYAVNSVGTAYGEEVTFTTAEDESSEPTGTENEYGYVDLGLSIKWATMNVGASKLEDYGDYFAWGETQPKSTYNWSTYKYCNGSSSTLTKYNTNSSYGTVDNKTTLDLNDDAANANWGGSWRMPTDAEWEELINNCTWTWTTQNGVYGRKVTSKTNGNSIFLPATSYSYDRWRGSGGSWSSSLNTDSPVGAWSVVFDFGGVNRNSYSRYDGRSVRPVCP